MLVAIFRTEVSAIEAAGSRRGVGDEYAASDFASGDPFRRAYYLSSPCYRGFCAI